ncbi:P-loop containing nucleoside triphosphate hydrolase protein [Clohesyomyces aquaticus]|uniref:p-loop containing nucleoside triphosphate hydrolase protein n=1 Tax=Clohesyomyces aquaticus TaxID=1231657 RepID=A0A1Y1YFS0_9PLEO|nr:P-loop containing nucleoside triphosphate hydrolase protein [Clohesyomyces aquaticus]
MLESPFEPLLHNWKRLHTLVTNDCDGEEWQALKPKMAKLRTDTVSAVPGNEDDVIIKAKEDLVVLLNQVQSAPGMDPFLETIKNFGSNRTIQFKHLWTIFPPGELVISNLFMDAPQAFIVQECSSEIHDESDAGTQKEKQVWMLWCWSYDWNGKTFDRVLVYFKFEEYPGARMINTLHCHPLQYHFVDDASDAKIVQLKEDMIERGKLYRDYAVRDVGAQMFDYTGSAISHGSGFQRLKNGQNQSDRDNFIEFMFGRRRGRPPPSKSGEVRQITGRVMVDFDSYIQHAPNVGQRPPMGKAMYSARSEECRCGACTNNQLLIANQRRNFDDFTADKPFADDEQYLLCPPRVLGYHLGTRTWLELNVNTIKSISQPASNRAFTKLQLLERDKDLIQALVQSHTSGTGKEPMMEDIVSGKGKGLVILLHGPPGVGKTLTAESVAEMAGKPLFAVSPSDIGLEPADVEHNLESLFELAARWRAVLLFDEADVFLESRSAHTSDLTRNALVSVLLRVLEYYSGILILTTNRITQFDIAVQSRVNLGIRYTDLSIEQKQKIFEQFLADVKEDLVEERQEILKWFKKDPDAIEWFDTMNGRQVRNVLFSAASLALKDGQCLKLRHIKTMARSTAKFQDSLRSIVLTARSKNEVGRINE